jgi:hypothetical protein
MTPGVPLACLASHRLRGFSGQDSTLDGLRRALASRVRHIEFDLRLSRDGVLAVFHDPFFLADGGQWRFIGEMDLAALRVQPALKHMATFDEFCQCIAERRNSGVRLHVDVKIGGQEKAIHAILEKYGLLESALIASWLPGVLFEFNAISPQTRLSFCHLSFARYPYLYGIARRLTHAAILSPVQKLLSLAAPRASKDLETLQIHYHDDGDPRLPLTGTGLTQWSYVHAVKDMLAGSMLALLQRTHGMVCLPAGQASEKLRMAYEARGIGLAVFGQMDARAISKVYSRIGPEIVYIDIAEPFLV